MAAGYGAPAAPYTGVPDWQPNGAPGGHLGPGGHDEFVNGGDYAYVIREDDPAASSSRSRPKEWGRLGEWSPGNAAPAQDNAQDNAQGPGQARAPGTSAGSASVRGRAITSGAPSNPAGASVRPVETAASAGAARAAATVAPAGARPHAPAAPAGDGLSALGTGADTADTAGGTRDTAAPAAAIPLGGPAPAQAASGVVDPDLAYGPDDPGYGPPGLGWYRRAEEAPAASVAPERVADAEESLAERGPFEPVHHDELADGGQPNEDGDGAQPEADMPEFDPIGGETPDLLDFGPDDPAGPLGGLRNLYRTAEAIGSDHLERNLDRLLDRQRKLITEYFTPVR